MKTKYFSLTIMGVALITLLACSEPDPFGEKKAADSQLSVSNAYMSFDLTRTGTVNVTASEGLEWDAYCNENWVSIDNSHGIGSRSITISAIEDNPSTSSRKCTVNLTSYRYNRHATINVEQEGTYLRVNKSEVDFPTKGGEQEISIESNAAWSIDSKPVWVTAKSTGNKVGSSNITLSVDANPNETDQVGYLVLKNAATEQSIKIIQSKALLTVNSNSLSFEQGSGQTKTVTVKSNVDWTVRSSESWCTVTPKSGSGNKDFIVAVLENTTSSTRTAYIYVESGNIKRTITVSQKGIELTVSPSSLAFESGSGSKTVYVTSNVSWTATSSQTSWCTVSKTSSSVTVKVTANPDATSRSATITIKAGSASKTVSVTQDGNFSISMNTRNYKAGGDYWSMYISVPSGQSWTASSNQSSWVKFSYDINGTKKTPYTGTGYGSIWVHVDANPTSSSRTATITVKAGTASKTLTITQDAGTLTVNKTSISLGYRNTTNSASFNITSNTDWVITKTGSWLSVSKTSGTGNASITISAGKYTTGTRNATITIKTPTGGITRTISVSQ